MYPIHIEEIKHVCQTMKLKIECMADEFTSSGFVDCIVCIQYAKFLIKEFAVTYMIVRVNIDLYNLKICYYT